MTSIRRAISNHSNGQGTLGSKSFNPLRTANKLIALISHYTIVLLKELSTLFLQLRHIVIFKRDNYLHSYLI